MCSDLVKKECSLFCLVSTKRIQFELSACFDLPRKTTTDNTEKLHLFLMQSARVRMVVGGGGWNSDLKNKAPMATSHGNSGFFITQSAVGTRKVEVKETQHLGCSMLAPNRQHVIQGLSLLQPYALPAGMGVSTKPTTQPYWLSKSSQRKSHGLVKLLLLYHLIEKQQPQNTKKRRTKKNNNTTT